MRLMEVADLSNAQLAYVVGQSDRQISSYRKQITETGKIDDAQKVGRKQVLAEVHKSYLRRSLAKQGNVTYKDVHENLLAKFKGLNVCYQVVRIFL